MIAGFPGIGGGPLAEMIFERNAPAWLLALLIGAGVAGVVLLARRYLAWNRLTLTLIAVRLAFLGVLAWCLGLPIEKQALTELRKPRFLVAVDASASMSLSPTSSVPARWSVAQSVLGGAWRETVAAQCEVDAYALVPALSEKMALDQVAQLRPEGPASPLRASLVRMLDRYRGQKLAGLLLLTDALDTREAGDDWINLDWPCPVYTLKVEPPDTWQEETDVAVDSVDAPRRVVVGWNTKLTAVVSGRGTRGETLHVQLFKDRALLQDVPTQLPSAGGTREVSFPLENPAIGAFSYEVVVPPLPGESSTNNNAYALSVQVVDARNRLLYIEDTPRWESKYLTRVLQGNANITPLIFLRGPGGAFLTIGQRGGQTLDLTEAQLGQLKMVILGDLDAKALTDERASRLVRFVEEGGSLLVLGGMRAWGEQGVTTGPMGKVMPVRRVASGPPAEGQFAVALTDEGRAHPAFLTQEGVWDRLPPVLSVFASAQPTAGASVLATAATPEGPRPLIVVQRYGQGKAVVVLTDTLWRWQLDPGSEKPYARFWTQMLQWLMPQKEEISPYQLDLYSETDRLFLGEALTLNARIGTATEAEQPADASVQCVITGPDERALPFPMGRRTVTTAAGRTTPGYAVDFSPEKPGLYKAVAKSEIRGRPVESAAYSFFVQSVTPETAPRAARLDLLERMARASGGRFGDANEIGAALARLSVTADQAERTRYVSRWNSPWLIGLLVGLLALEWYLRRTRNMA